MIFKNPSLKGMNIRNGIQYISTVFFRTSSPIEFGNSRVGLIYHGCNILNPHLQLKLEIGGEGHKPVP